MNKKSKARNIIRALEKDGFYAECPSCAGKINLKDCGLFYLDEFTESARGVYERLKEEQDQRAVDLRARRTKISVSSQVGAQAVNTGLILERLAPCMDSFRFERTDCRSLFDPIDYLIFEGLTEKNVVSRILFMEIKTGRASLKNVQKKIKSLVESKKVSWAVYKPENGK